MTNTKHGGVSLRPEDAGEGGLFDDVTVRIEKARFESFNYQGKSVAAPGIVLGLKDINDESDYEQFYSMGSAKDWTPSEDGTELLYVGSAENPFIRKSTNGMHLITSIIDSGFPPEDFYADVSAFEGMVCHMQRIPAPKRSGIAKKTGPDGKEYADTILVVDKIVTLPGEAESKPKAKAAGAPAGAKKSTGKKGASAKKKASVADDSSLADKATAYLIEQLAENPDGVQKKDLPVMFVSHFKTDADRNKLVNLVYADEFLANGPWTYEGSTITL